MTTNTGPLDPTPVPTAQGVVFGSFSAVGYSGTSALDKKFSWSGNDLGGIISSTNWADFTGSLNEAKYYEVTFTPRAGYALDLSTISFGFNRITGAFGTMPCVRAWTSSPRTCRPASIRTRLIWRCSRTTASSGSGMRQTQQTTAKTRWTWAPNSQRSLRPSRSGSMDGTRSKARVCSPSTTSSSPAARSPCLSRERSPC